MRIKASNDYVLRNIVDEYILLPVGEKQKEFQGAIRINEISAFVWKIISEETKFDVILNQILSEYEIDKQTAENDLKQLINQFAAFHLVEVYK